MADPLFDKIALVGIGLIGSSLARVIRRKNLARRISISTRRAGTLERARELVLPKELVELLNRVSGESSYQILFRSVRGRVRGIWHLALEVARDHGQRAAGEIA